MGDPPFEAGAVKDMVAWEGDDVAAETPVGAPGGDHGRVVVERMEPYPVPEEFTAYARK